MVGGWSNPFLCHSQLELRLSWAVTIKSNVSRMVLKRSSMGCFTFSQGSFKLHGSLESKVCIGWLGWAVVIINLQLTL